MDYYEEFGVPRSASQREIRSAWKRLARFYHPDLQTDPEMRATAELEMRRLNQMLSVLTQPLERVRYDLMLEAERNAPPAPPLWGPPPGSGLGFQELLRFDRKAAIWLSGGALAAGIVAVIVMASLQVGTTADRAAKVTVAVSNAPAPLPDTGASRRSRISRSREKLTLPEPFQAPAHAPSKTPANEGLAMVGPAPAAAKPYLPPAVAKPTPATATPKLVATAPKPSLPPAVAKPAPATAAKSRLVATAPKPSPPPAVAKPAPTVVAKPNLVAKASSPNPPPTAAMPVPAAAAKPDLAANTVKPTMAPSSGQISSEARLENQPSNATRTAAAVPVPAASSVQPNVARAVEPAPATNPTSIPATATQLARTPEPASPSPATPSPAVSHPAQRAGGLAGLWRYDPAKEASRSAGFYAAERIELNVFEEAGGALHGYYTAHYRVPDGGVSPDVAFNFSGGRGREPGTATWSGDNGNRGEIRFRVLSDSALEVVWVTTRIKHANSLVSGKVTLRRAN